MDTIKEQLILKQSIWITLGLSLFSISFGLWVNSEAITFEGFYSVIDAIMTTAALLVSKLIMGEGTRRFQYGYWHLEPLVAACNGTILAITCLYALVNGINGVLEGGTTVNFELAIFYAVIASIISLGMFLYIHYANKTLNSEFLRIDAQGWLISGTLAAALCLSFLIALFFTHTRFEYLLPYTDPAVLILLCVLLIQIPIRTVWRAMHDVLIVTPVELDEKVQDVVKTISKRYHFIGSKNHVAKIGRALFIEINILTHPDFAVEGIATLDRVRAEIADQLEEEQQIMWLTITFTANKKWL